jgi:primosomal protein N' (replication factor Y)
VVRVNDRFRYRITIIGKNDKVLRDLIAAYMKEFARRRENKNLHIFTDCNRMD